jgi:predicted dehydrogenase
MVTIVVEGIGDIVSKPTGYGRAIQKLKIDKGADLRVIFTDICDAWHTSADPDLWREREDTKAELLKSGAEFIDKSPSKPDQRKKYQELLHQQVDAVFVATPDKYHIEVARHWLKGNCKRIFIEKPLTNDPDEARQWMAELGSNPHDRERLTQLDHYLPKIQAEIQYDRRVRQMLEGIGRQYKKRVGQMLERVGRLKAIRFYMLEDHSGTDEDYQNEMARKGRKDRNGPIENERRTDTLDSGVSLDLLPHLLAILYHFGDLRTIKVDSLIAGKYVGVDYDDTKPAGIRGETFAAAQFTFMDLRGRKIRGEANVGKGIRGSKKYPSMNGNVKILELEGTWGRIEFDFNNNVESFINGTNIELMMDLEPDPYYYLLRDVAFKRVNRGTDLGMPITTGAMILDKIDTEITSRTNRGSLPIYKLGDKHGRQPPFLEDLVRGGINALPTL